MPSWRCHFGFLERILGVVVATQLEVQSKEDGWAFNDSYAELA